MFIRLISELLL